MKIVAPLLARGRGEVTIALRSAGERYPPTLETRGRLGRIGCAAIGAGKARAGVVAQHVGDQLRAVLVGVERMKHAAGLAVIPDDIVGATFARQAAKQRGELRLPGQQRAAAARAQRR